MTDPDDFDDPIWTPPSREEWEAGIEAARDQWIQDVDYDWPDKWADRIRQVSGRIGSAAPVPVDRFQQVMDQYADSLTPVEEKRTAWSRYVETSSAPWWLVLGLALTAAGGLTFWPLGVVAYVLLLVELLAGGPRPWSRALVLAVALVISQWSLTVVLIDVIDHTTRWGLLG